MYGKLLRCGVHFGHLFYSTRCYGLIRDFFYHSHRKGNGEEGIGWEGRKFFICLILFFDLASINFLNKVTVFIKISPFSSSSVLSYLQQLKEEGVRVTRV